MKEKFIDSILTITQHGFSWQETIIISLALAAIVLITLILTNGIVKICVSFLSIFGNLFYKIGHSIRTLFNSTSIN
jgi:hypothetical protein